MKVSKSVKIGLAVALACWYVHMWVVVVGKARELEAEYKQHPEWVRSYE